MAGRKPVPQEVKDLRGTDRADRDNRNAPKFSGKPSMPPQVKDWPEAEAEWIRVVDQLEALDLLKSTDQAMLTGYVVAWALWLDALKTIREEGQTVKEAVSFDKETGEATEWKIKRHPASVVASDSLKNLKGLASLFGFDPSSRTKLHVADSGQPAKSEHERYLSGDEDEDAPVSSREMVN